MVLQHTKTIGIFAATILKKAILVNNYILADNQDLTGFAFESLIRQDDAQSEIRKASNRASLTHLLEENAKSVVILDYTLFDFTDEEQLIEMSEKFAAATWILVSGELTEKLIRRVVYSSNMFSIIFKDSSLPSIREALSSASQGKRYICQRAMEMLLARQQESDEQEVLTATEMAIAVDIALGKTTKEIAKDRFSSVHTITTHRKNIFRKLKVNTAHEVIKYALRAGWVDPSDFYTI